MIPGSLIKVVGKSTKLAAELIHIEQKLAKMPIGFAGQGVAFAARETGILAEEFGVVAKEARVMAEAGFAKKAAGIGVKEFLSCSFWSNSDKKYKYCSPHFERKALLG